MTLRSAVPHDEIRSAEALCVDKAHGGDGGWMTGPA